MARQLKQATASLFALAALVALARGTGTSGSALPVVEEASLSPVSAGAPAGAPGSKGPAAAAAAAVSAAGGVASAARPDVPAERVQAANRLWQGLAAGVRALDPSDQRGLDELYARAREAILADEAAWAEAMRQSMGELTRATLEESFFAASAWTRYSHAPAGFVQALWQGEPPAEAPSPDSHHELLTPAVKYQRLEAYSLRELRTQYGQGHVALGGAEERALVDGLVPRATREQSLDVALEMFQLMKALQEQQGIQTALGGHSERDQQLIRGVLAVN